MTCSSPDLQMGTTLPGKDALRIHARETLSKGPFRWKRVGFGLSGDMRFDGGDLIAAFTHGATSYYVGGAATSRAANRCSTRPAAPHPFLRTVFASRSPFSITRTLRLANIAERRSPRPVDEIRLLSVTRPWLHQNRIVRRSHWHARRADPAAQFCNSLSCA